MYHRQECKAQGDLDLDEIAPPPLLYHGTARRHLDGIRANGLLPGQRQHVHLSADCETARRVGSRHGPPVVLKVRSGDLAATGHRFWHSANGVWLTDRVPPAFITFDDATD